MPSFLMVSTGKEETEGGLAPTGEVGYYRHDRHEILKLCNQIAAPDLGLETRSIPDTWAQVIKLQQSLLALQSQGDDEIGPLLLQVRAQWRGLLALVVLRREMNFQDQLQFTPAISENGAGSFSRVARELLPDDLTLVDVGWKSIHLISFRGVTLGCTSPLTFVCPAATKPVTSQSPLVIPGCNWFSDGLFKDPVEAAESSYLQILQAWIRNTLKRLAPTQHSDTDSDEDSERERLDYLSAVRGVNLRALLNSYEKDIQQRLVSLLRKGASRIVENDLSSEIDSSFQTSKDVQESLRSLQFTPKGYNETHILRSPFLLRPVPGASPKQSILLIHNDLIRHPNFDGGKIEMLRGISLNRALQEYRRGVHHQIESVNVTPGAIYSADEIFCDKIFVARIEKGFLGAHDFRGVSSLRKKEDTAGLSPVLPLRAEFIDHFSPEYLVRSVEFSGTEDEIKVSLKVFLGASSDPFTFSRTYKSKDSQIEYGRLPELQIWPEYSQKELPGWKCWYAYYNDLSNPGNRLYMSPRSEYCNATSGRNDEPVHSLITDSEDKQKRVEIHRCSVFPAIFECSLESNPIGIILPKPRERKEAKQSGSWEVSIDFGTTGTSVFYSQNGEIGNLVLEPRLLAVTTNLGVPGDNYYFFLPSEDANTDGILSIFKEFRAVQSNSQTTAVTVKDITPTLGGHISFQERSKDLHHTKHLESQGVYADMKWGTSEEQARGKAFLMQLCLLTALRAKVEGARSIRWVFSYPLSFSPTRYDNFKAVWRNCARFALELSGLNATDPREPFRQRDESTSAAKYAQEKHQADLGGGSIVLDIGGGSTDLSIWANPGGFEPKCIHNTSVKFAGRDIFQRPLRAKPQLLNHFVPSELVTGVSSARAMQNETLFFSQIDSLFKTRSNDVLHLLDSKQSEPMVKEFIGILSVGLRGLFFYTGLILRSLAEKGAIEQRLPDIFVCGNGGKILHWLNFGDFVSGSNAERRLLGALGSGASFAAETQEVARITLSGNPKTEAAYGMLVDPSERARDIKNEPISVLGGEVYKLGDRKFDVLDTVPFAELTDRAFVVSDDLPTINKFLESSGQRRLPPRTQRDIVARTNGRLTEIAKKRKERKPDDGDSQAELEQPIFIIALNELIKQAADDWAAGRSEPWWL